MARRRPRTSTAHDQARRLGADWLPLAVVGAVLLFARARATFLWQLSDNAATLGAGFLAIGAVVSLQRWSVGGLPTGRAVVQGVLFAAAATALYWWMFLHGRPERWWAPPR